MRDACLGLFKAVQKVIKKQGDQTHVPSSFKTPCWEFRNCGRQPGGEQARALGVCPVAEAEFFHGNNNGPFAGRVCWKLNSASCKSGDTISIMAKLRTCMQCDFFKAVREEEGQHFDIGI